MTAHANVELERATGADVKKLGEMIEGIQMAMLTTVEPDGSLRSRPMATQRVPFDGVLWFFMKINSGKVGEIEGEHHVNVSYSDVKHQRYVSVSGIGRTVLDHEKAKELWNPLYKAWFPEGLADPYLSLLKVEVTEAEYWDSPHSAVVRMAGFVKALVTGKAYEGGENKRVELG